MDDDRTEWTAPKGPLPSSHLIAHHFVSRASRPMIALRCGLWRGISDEELAAIEPVPASPNEGPTCETCLRLMARDRVAALEEATASGPSEA